MHLKMVKNNLIFVLTKALCLFLLVSAMQLSSASVLLSDQGTDIKEVATGNLLSSGNLTIEIYDAATGGNQVYYQNFTNAIYNGSWNVMISPNVEYGKFYYKDYRINNEDLDFDGDERLAFQAPIGLINNASFFNFSLIGVCPNGSSIRQVYENGSVVCETDDSESGSGSSDLTNHALKNQSEIFQGNITTSHTGFFGFLGSLISRITKLFVQDIDASGNIDVGGNINVAKNISAGYYCNASNCYTLADLLSTGSGSDGSYNATYSAWAYNQSLWLLNQYGLYWYNMSDGTGAADGSYNSTYAIWAYNQSDSIWHYNMSVSGTGDGSYNSTYESFSNWAYNHSSWILNEYGKWFYNMSDGGADGSYNSTYAAFANFAYNMSDGSYNATYSIWAYNQTTSNDYNYNESTYLINTYGKWWYNFTLADIYSYNFTGTGIYYYNQSDGSFNITYQNYAYNQTGNYAYNMSDGSYNSTYAQYAYNMSDGSYNSTYNLWAYNQTRLSNYDYNESVYLINTYGMFWYNQTGIYQYNQSDGSFNITYQNFAYNMSDGSYNATYAIWAYNQTTSNDYNYNESTYLINTYGKWWYNFTLADIYSYNFTGTGIYYYNMSDGSYNSTYAMWAYNQSDSIWHYNQSDSLWHYNMSDGSYNSTYNLWAYNQTMLSDYNYNESTYLINTYGMFWYNQTGIYNYNQSDGSFNLTYQNYAYNMSDGSYNATYSIWAYNQTTSNDYNYNESTYLINTYGKWWYNFTLADIYSYNFTGTGIYYYNMSDGSYNSTYAIWAYNQSDSIWHYNQTGTGIYYYNQTTFALTTLATNITNLNASSIAYTDSASQNLQSNITNLNTTYNKWWYNYSLAPVALSTYNATYESYNTSFGKYWYNFTGTGIYYYNFTGTGIYYYNFTGTGIYYYNFSLYFAPNTTKITYQNITNWPTCSGTDKLTADGITLTCAADQTGSQGSSRMFQELEELRFTTNNTAFAVGLFNFTIEAYQNDTFECLLFVNSTVATTGVQINVTVPTSPRWFAVSFKNPSTIVAYNISSCVGTMNNCISANTAGVLNAVTGLEIKGRLRNGPNGGILNISLKSEIANSRVSVQPGSYCFVQNENQNAY